MNAKESLKRRRKAFLNEMNNKDVDIGIFVSERFEGASSNFLYLAGEEHTSTLYGRENNVLIFDKNGRSTAILPFWGVPEIEALGIYDHVVPIRQDIEEQAAEIWKSIKKFHTKGKIGLDLSTMSVRFAMLLKDRLDIELSEEIDIKEIVYSLRTIKDAYEVSETKKAVSITEDAIVDLATKTKFGRRLEDLKTSFQVMQTKKGAIWSPPPYLMFTRGGNPLKSDDLTMFVRGQGIVKHGDLLGVDAGCSVKSGYNSDMCRMIPTTSDPKVKEFLDEAIAAHCEGEKLIRDGVLGSEVWSATEKISEQYGHGPTPRCGHQIGLCVHDDTSGPNFGPTDKKPLRKGMIMAYETLHTDAKNKITAYFEDDILVEENGPKILNDLPWNFLW